METHSAICSVRNAIARKIYNNWKVNMSACGDAMGFVDDFPISCVEKKSVRESPLKREVQAVKSILQGGSSSMRDHSHSHQDSQHSRDGHRQAKDDKAKLKKRNLLEVFKKPSNAKEIGKPAKQRTSPHAIDKFELECIEILKVSPLHLLHKNKSSFAWQKQKQSNPSVCRMEIFNTNL